MTHKENCAAHAMQFLQSRSLEHCYNQSLFNYWYNQSKRKGGNPYLIGLNAADLMINSPLNNSEDERANEN